MSNQTGLLAKRLCEAESPQKLQDWETKDGYYIATCRVTTGDVPVLIDIASKWRAPDWTGTEFELDVDSDTVELLPVSAWRSLADLKSSESVEPLIELLCATDGEDDWVLVEFPHVFGKIGKPGVEAIVRLANDTDKPEFVRSIAAESLQRVAEYHAEIRDEIVDYLTEMLAHPNQDTINFNSMVLFGLVELVASEAAEVIERAFASGCLDVGVIGDWETVRRQLGVEGLGLEMPSHPYNSVDQFRIRVGIGIFSDERIFENGECIDAAEQDYYERAWKLFSKSREAQEIRDRFGRLHWFQSLLQYGLQYRGEIVDAITVGTVEDFVMEYIPRKVSTEPDQATAIISELTKFWEYVNRVFELPNAQAVIEWLKTDRLAATLDSRMSDPANFGMAKSMVMSGMEAGYDMTSKEGMAKFIAAYNESLQPRAASTSIVGRQKVGRNDPCPCGSGKKFKKCCR